MVFHKFTLDARDANTQSMFVNFEPKEETVEKDNNEQQLFELYHVSGAASSPINKHLF